MKAKELDFKTQAKKFAFNHATGPENHPKIVTNFSSKKLFLNRKAKIFVKTQTPFACQQKKLSKTFWAH